MAPGLGGDHGPAEADQDDEDLEQERDGVHGEVEDQQQAVVALGDRVSRGYETLD